MTEWRVERNNTEFVDNLFDVEVTDALNRFGRHAIAYIDDSAGEKFDKFPRGTRVDFEYSTDGGSTFQNRFSGYVVETTEANRSGADALEVEAYSFDHFLRRNTNERDLSGKTISTALQELIQDFTPVTYDASLVTVENDETLNRGFRGDKVDTIIDTLSSKSTNEEFGVNDAIEFFFRPRETEKAPRSIDNTQWLDYDLPEKGKEAVNEVKVFYNDGNDAVIVDDGNDKQELENTLNTPKPVTLESELQFNDITTQEAAKEKAEQVLNERATTLTGTVTTFDLFDASPGDVIDVEIVERGLDSEFRIAAIEYRWGPDETILTIRENKGGQTDKLVRLVDRLDRVELRTADRDAVATRFLEPGTTEIDFEVTVDVVIRRSSNARFQPGFGRDTIGFGREDLGFGNEPDTFVSEKITRVTNVFMNAVRDAWKGDTPPAIDTVALGSGDSTPSRSDTSLDVQEATSSVSNTLNRGLNGVRFSGEITFSAETTIAEAGLLDGSNLHSRSTIDEITVDANLPTDVIYNIQPILNTSTAGVLTDTGLTTVVDIAANDSPDTPDQYLFGSDDTDAQQSDTSLGNLLATEPIDRYETGSPSVVSAFGSLGSSQLVGSTLAEMGLENSANELLTRVTFADVVKESGQVIEGRTQIDFNNE
jgi:hypothetical protein